ncbi:Tribbles-like protein [Sarcoptes scabiei]|nr:Tribbles-like protein [Sarcoptes scabiei]
MARMESIRSSPSMMMIILMITIWSTIIVAKQHGWFLKWKEMSNQNLLEVNYREYHGVPESCNKSSSGSIFKLRKDYKQCHNQSVTKFSLTPENLITYKTKEFCCYLRDFHQCEIGVLDKCDDEYSRLNQEETKRFLDVCQEHWPVKKCNKDETDLTPYVAAGLTLLVVIGVPVASWLCERKWKVFAPIYNSQFYRNVKDGNNWLGKLFRLRRQPGDDLQIVEVPIKIDHDGRSSVSIDRAPDVGSLNGSAAAQELQSLSVGDQTDHIRVDSRRESPFEARSDAISVVSKQTSDTEGFSVWKSSGVKSEARYDPPKLGPKELWPSDNEFVYKEARVTRIGVPIIQKKEIETNLFTPDDEFILRVDPRGSTPQPLEYTPILKRPRPIQISFVTPEPPPTYTEKFAQIVGERLSELVTGIQKRVRESLQR